MSSRRFPGKVLAPFRGRPILWHVVHQVAASLPQVPRVLVTSTEPSDDPIAAYADRLEIACFRGPLEDVFERFRAAAREHPASWILRVCADSPLLDPSVLAAVVSAPRDDVDLVTTTEPRTFPRGHNVELIRTQTLLDTPAGELEGDDREHVTSLYHRRRDRYRLRNVESGDPARAQLSFAVDTLEDLQRLEASA